MTFSFGLKVRLEQQIGQTSIKKDENPTEPPTTIVGPFSFIDIVLIAHPKNHNRHKHVNVKVQP
jgi:hypothetical protein